MISNKNASLYLQLKELTDMYNRKEYQKVLREASSFRIKEQNHMDVLMAFCYLHLKDTNEASFYIDRVLENDPYHSFGLLAGAYRDLYQGKVVAAIYIYTRLINFKKHLFRVKKILRIIKDKKRADNIHREKDSSFFIPIKLKMSYWGLEKPPSRFPLPRISLEWIAKPPAKKFFKFFIPIFFLTVFLAIILHANKSSFAVGISSAWNYFSSKMNFLQSKTDPSTPDDKNWRIDKLNDLSLIIDPNLKVPRDQLFESFSSVKKDIFANKINEAIIRSNEIILSDTDESVKKQFKNLINHIPSINSLSFFKETPKLSTVISDNKYLETYIIIKGTLKPDNNKNRVWLSMIDDPKIKSVFVKVDKEFLKNLDYDAKYEVLARYDGFDEKTKEISLEGIDFRKQ